MSLDAIGYRAVNRTDFVLHGAASLCKSTLSSRSETSYNHHSFEKKVGPLNTNILMPKSVVDLSMSSVAYRSDKG